MYKKITDNISSYEYMISMIGCHVTLCQSLYLCNMIANCIQRESKPFVQ